MTRRRSPTAARALGFPFAAWLGGLALLVAVVGFAPVNRTQEARVLETAREMAAGPAVDWLIPKLNGRPRLRKPPGAYWASAVAFRVFGTGERVGRLPVVLAFGGTLGLTYLTARRLFGRRAALVATLALPGMWLAFKEGLLAETDGYATLGVTAAVYAILRAADVRSPLPVRPGRRREGGFDRRERLESPQPPSLTLPRAYTGEGTGWTHVVGVCLALTVLAKGPPAAFPVLFWVGLCAVRGQWRSLVRFVTRGGLLTAVVLAVPWFVYVARHSTAEGQLSEDLLNSADGGDHHGPPWQYVPLLFQATLPWTAVWGAGVWMAAGRLWRGRAAGRAAGVSAAGASAGFGRGVLLSIRHAADAPATGGLVTLLVWAAAVLVPLSCWGNKQFHYLLPVLPPTAILVGWAVAAAQRRRPWAKAAAVALAATAVLVAVVAGGATAALLRHPPPHATPNPTADLTLAGLWLSSVVLLALAVRAGRLRPTRELSAAAALLAFTAVFLGQAWVPATGGSPSRRTALRLLADYPAARFGVRGSELPVMSWSIRREVPALDAAAIAARPADLVVLDQQQADEGEPAVPDGYVEVRRFRQRENTLHAYVATGSPLAGPRVDVDVR